MDSDSANSAIFSQQKNNPISATEPYRMFFYALRLWLLTCGEQRFNGDSGGGSLAG
jgi:hypothetical protein